jgi:ribosomal protein S18 acetylase RimI-like enzyme
MLRSRPFAGEGDFPALHAFLVSLRSQIGPACWHVGDLAWRFFLHSICHDLSRTVRLWEDGAGLVGFAIVTPPRRAKEPAHVVTSFDLQVHPRGRESRVEDEIVLWVTGEAARADLDCALPTARRRLVAEAVYEEEGSSLRSLERLGFRRGDWEAALLARSLDEPIAAAPLPAGFSLRLVRREEIAERAAAHREAFDPSRVTDEHYLRLIGTAEYAQALDLVAISEDGRVSSFAIAWRDEVNREVEFEPVGTRPCFRRRGLAKAVLYEGLRRANAQGARSAVVGPVDLRDEPALRLYEGTGFRPCCRVVNLVRESE